MRYILFSLTLLLFTITFQAQNNFQSGYYINSNGDRIDGLIKNINQKSNPQDIIFKVSEMGPEMKIPLKNMKGFEIDNSIRYDKFRVKISKSSDKLAFMDRVREFELVEETALLELLIDGDVQLYKYEDEGVTQFFIKKDNLLNTLLYKKFLLSGGVTENNQYKQQILNLLNCESGKLPDVSKLKYTERSLKTYVKKYNMCKGNLDTSLESEDEKNVLSIKLLAGVQNSSFSVESNEIRTFDYGSQTSFIPGVEFELKFPTRSKDEVSIFLDARIHSFEGNGIYDIFNPFNSEGTVLRETRGTYDAVDLGLGGRYYLGLSENSKIYFGINGSIDFYTETLFEYDGPAEDNIEGQSPTIILGLGLGYNWKNISAEARYYTNRNTISGFATNESDYSNLAFTLSYSLFNIKI